MKRDIDFSDDDSPEEHERKKRAQKVDSMRMLQKLEVEKEYNDLNTGMDYPFNFPDDAYRDKKGFLRTIDKINDLQHIDFMHAKTREQIEKAQAEDAKYRMYERVSYTYFAALFGALSGVAIAIFLNWLF